MTTDHFLLSSYSAARDFLEPIIATKRIKSVYVSAHGTAMTIQVWTNTSGRGKNINRCHPPQAALCAVVQAVLDVGVPVVEVGGAGLTLTDIECAARVFGPIGFVRTPHGGFVVRKHGAVSEQAPATAPTHTAPPSSGPSNPLAQIGSALASVGKEILRAFPGEQLGELKREVEEYVADLERRYSLVDKTPAPPAATAPDPAPAPEQPVNPDADLTASLPSLALEAERLASLGYYVLPLVPGGKALLPGLVCSADQASNDVEVVRRWWAAHPDANIGLALFRSGLVALDVQSGVVRDVPKVAGGTAAFRTPRGGLQHLYRRTSGIEPTDASLVVVNRDVTLVVRGYVVVPPSRTAKGGYYWLRSNAAVAPVPHELADMVYRPVTEVARTTSAVFVTQPGPSTHPPRGAEPAPAPAFAEDPDVARRLSDLGQEEATRIRQIAATERQRMKMSDVWQNNRLRQLCWSTETRRALEARSAALIAALAAGSAAPTPSRTVVVETPEATKRLNRAFAPDGRFVWYGPGDDRVRPEHAAAPAPAAPPAPDPDPDLTRTAAEVWLRTCRGILVTVDLRAAGLVLPALPPGFNGVALRIGHQLVPALPELRTDDHGITCTLHFGGAPHRCVIPWGALTSVTRL